MTPEEFMTKYGLSGKEAFANLWLLVDTARKEDIDRLTQENQQWAKDFHVMKDRLRACAEAADKLAADLQVAEAINEDHRRQYDGITVIGAISNEHIPKIRAFRDEHNTKHGHNSGAIGGRFTWKFTSTNLGQISVLECSCGERLDLTPYHDW